MEKIFAQASDPCSQKKKYNDNSSDGRTSLTLKLLYLLCIWREYQPDNDNLQKSGYCPAYISMNAQETKKTI